MRVVFIRPSKGKSQEVSALVSDYLKRLERYISCELIEPKARGTSKSYTAPAIWNESSTYRVVLDDKGKQYTSPELSQRLKTWKERPEIKTVAFFIGDPYGIPPEIAEKTHEKWSLSKGTFPSDLAWLVTIEQIYRGFSILASSPYHHE